jgi:penicillin-binding protein 1A
MQWKALGAQIAQLAKRARERLKAMRPARRERAPGEARERVAVSNPADGGFFYWLLKLYGFSLAILAVASVVAGVSVYGWFSQSAPETPDLDRYATVVPGVSRVYAGDGSLLGEFADEWREIVPYEKIPKQLIDAVLATEDHDFFRHGGLYPKGIARALWQDLKTGELSQGGSTITQQVAKQFLGNEKTLERKGIEAIMARRLESRYSKEEILSVYLNHIFLGSGAYGVQAAAHRYYSKDVWDLNLGEIAMIAGLAQSPSNDSPLEHPDAAKKRRDTVLDRMVKYAHLDPAEAEKWKATSVEGSLHPYKDVFLTTEPYFAEHVRRAIVKNKNYGLDGLMKKGLTIETTIEPWMDSVAYANVDWNTRKQDKRQGWRGPEAHLEGAARDTFLERSVKKYGAGPLEPEKRYLAIVDSVKSDGAKVTVGGGHYTLPIDDMKWASKWSKTNFENDNDIDDARRALKVGDVVWVSRPPTHIKKFSDWTFDDHLNARWKREGDVKVGDDEVELEQTPHVQGALLTFDHQSGYVLAMVGGQDYARSEYNRTVQACRQPGSTYKPIYYSLALDDGYGFDTTLNDVPKAEVDPITGEVWTPENLHHSVENEVSLEHALVFSKNVPSVDLFKKVGADRVEQWARRLGFTSQIIPDRALALGASCTYMDELARAFSIFARNGRWLDLVYVRRVKDRDGRILEDSTVYYDPMLPAADRLDRLAATAGDRAKVVIPPRTAFLTTKLLRAMVTDGFNGNLRQTEITSAGKTGTSSATMDLWFVAFTDRWLTTTWLGDDLRERPLGRDDAAFMTSVPFWARYMFEVTQGRTFHDIPWEVPQGVDPKDRGGQKGVKQHSDDEDDDGSGGDAPSKT